MIKKGTETVGKKRHVWILLCRQEYGSMTKKKDILWEKTSRLGDPKKFHKKWGFWVGKDYSR